MKDEAQEVMDKMIDDMNKQPLKFAMQPTKITFEQLFPTGVYQNERLSIEIQLNDEDPIEAFKRARSLVQQAFHAMNPGIYDQTGTTVQPVEEPVVRSREDEIAAHLITINECKTLRNLQMFANMVQRVNDDRLYEAYHNKKKELTNKTN